MNKKESGRLGGLSTFNKYGREYMQEIGRNGAYKFWQKYDLLPYSTSGYVLVNKITNQIVAKIWR